MKEVQGRNHLDPRLAGFKAPYKSGFAAMGSSRWKQNSVHWQLTQVPRSNSSRSSAPVLREGVTGGEATWNRAMQREEQLGEGGAVINQTWQLYQEREPRVGKPDLFRPIAKSALEPPRFHLPETRPQGRQAHSPHILPTCNEDAPGSRARLVFTSSPSPLLTRVGLKPL